MIVCDTHKNIHTPQTCPVCMMIERDRLQTENKQLKTILLDYMRNIRIIARKIWDTKTAVSLHRMLDEMHRDIEQALELAELADETQN